MQSLDEEFKNLNTVKKVTIDKERSQVVSWNLNVPKNQSAIIYRIVASSGEFSDGEESALPVLTNRTLVTDRKSTRLNSSHVAISYAVFCLKKKKTQHHKRRPIHEH